jgi:hypothetical protein
MDTHMISDLFEDIAIFDVNHSKGLVPDCAISFAGKNI